MDKKIMTVLGPIDADSIGNTLMHEHCLVAAVDAYSDTDNNDPEYQAFLKSEICPENRQRIIFNMHKHQSNTENQDENLSIKELKYFKDAGGGTIVDVTTPGIGRDVNALARISKATGLNIVASTALYIEGTWPEKFRTMTQQQITDFMLDEIKNGIEETGIRPGYIGEVGMSDDWTKDEVKSLRASGDACIETGLSMTVHQPIFKTYGERVLDVLEEQGVDLDKVVLSHCDGTIPNYDYHVSLLERGCRLQFDEFMMEFPVTYGPYVKHWLPRDIDRIRHIKRLCDAGYEDRITLSYDMGAFKTLYKTYGGGGYAHIFENLWDFFLFEGVTEAQLNKILVENPKAILAR